MNNNIFCKVFLVGAGPGDVELITVKGKRLLETADVIIYDYLANPELLKYANKEAEKIYVGKRTSEHTVDQENINKIIVEKAKEGKIVVRLKGGDPFVFGRGGEEAEVLSKEGINFEVVPGVTSGIAAPMYAGIPLTMRGVNATVAFATGHEADDKELSHLDWHSLAGMGTLVFYMGVKNLPVIAKSLVDAGKSKDTPFAVIRWGTYPKQQVYTSTLSKVINGEVLESIKPPAIIVVGEVVKMRDKIGWFEKKPLYGKRIIVTRAKEQAGTFSTKLALLGAEVIEIPTIEIIPPESYDSLDNAINNIGQYDILILTSVNGVNHFFNRIKELKKDVRILSSVKICAIGPATKKAIEDRGIIVDIMPEKYVAESVVEKLQTLGIEGKRFLLARALVARDVIPQEITRLGGIIDVATVYRTVKPEDIDEKLKLLGEVDVITFTSSSTAKNFFDALHDKSLLNKTVIASIGPVTSETIRNCGFEPHIEAKVFTIDGLIEAVIGHFSKKKV